MNKLFIIMVLFLYSCGGKSAFGGKIKIVWENGVLKKMPSQMNLEKKVYDFFIDFFSQVKKQTIDGYSSVFHPFFGFSRYSVFLNEYTGKIQKANSFLRNIGMLYNDDTVRKTYHSKYAISISSFLRKPWDKMIFIDTHQKFLSYDIFLFAIGNKAPFYSWRGALIVDKSKLFIGYLEVMKN